MGKVNCVFLVECFEILSTSLNKGEIDLIKGASAFLSNSQLEYQNNSYTILYRGKSLCEYLNQYVEHMSNRSSHRYCSVKKVFLKNFANFTGRHLCWSLF